MTCIICNQPSRRAVGGVLLCGNHAAEADNHMQEQRAAGRPVDIARWAARRRNEGRASLLLKINPEQNDKIARIAAARGISKTALIANLIDNLQE